jgi:hypothetical protein
LFYAGLPAIVPGTAVVQPITGNPGCSAPGPAAKLSVVSG